MIKAMKIAVQLIWAISLITLGTSVGAIYGWEQHGWSGAIVVGMVGFGIGSVFAASPLFLFQFLRGFS
jgi:hypothetical protein